jgi:hypothetical protein
MKIQLEGTKMPEVELGVRKVGASKRAVQCRAEAGVVLAAEEASQVNVPFSRHHRGALTKSEQYNTGPLIETLFLTS